MQAYDVLVRIADGLGIPRGLTGLAYGEAASASLVGEVDEDMERLKLLAIAGVRSCLSTPIFGQSEPVAVRRVLTDPLRRVCMADVRMYEQTLLAAPGVAARRWRRPPGNRWQLRRGPGRSSCRLR